MPLAKRGSFRCNKNEGICRTCDAKEHCLMEFPPDIEMFKLWKEHPVELDDKGRVEWCPIHSAEEHNG